MKRLAACALLLLCAGWKLALPETFSQPEEALQRMGELLGSGQATDRLLGAGSGALLSSGDEEADRADALRVKQMLEEHVQIEDAGPGRKIALLGNDRWPFPFPLLQREERWHFDLEGGRREMLSRRIGRNELLALQTLHAVVDAQREFLALPREGPPRYARVFRSAQGEKDGLYWPVAAGEPESPLGPFLADAEVTRHRQGETRPFRGYFFRMLTAQAPRAAGGEQSYLDEQGRMTHGFAVLAWPARYASSGVMTFQVNRSGIVFQKDLGPDTQKRAMSIHAYAADESWDPTGD